MAYEWLSEGGGGVIAGAQAGAKISGNNPWAIGTGAVLGGLEGIVRGNEIARRNKKQEELSDLEIGDRRQNTLIELIKQKHKEEWQMQFGDALRSKLLSGVGA